MTVVTPRPKKPKKRAKRDFAKQCDVLMGQIVRREGRCVSGRLARHSGVIQWAHGFSRRYRAVRWDRRNGFALCAACHWWFTNHPIEWDIWLRETWGDALYEEMRDLALHGPVPDPKDVLAELKALAA